ncbi:hypothetical protein H4R34_002134 [Dimargaris verticillata]|uniref:GRAM domain-containing protein n=1 Tax=Dimargaris verticillata TaxID=2761393 RepID=A0A9W8E9L4_9FUNG|nr:hypothetical protein H4R34_002134 [Dimargaris verticillata]
MALNCVMLDLNTNRPIPLPREKFISDWTRVSLHVELGNGYPGTSQTHRSPSGQLYVTNQRVIYLCDANTGNFTSFSIPLGHVRQGRFVQPWFGANAFHCVVEPVPNGGLSGSGDTKITFKDGGGVEFLNTLRAAQERLAVEAAIGGEAEPLPRYAPPTNDGEQSSAMSNRPPLASYGHPISTGDVSSSSYSGGDPNAPPSYDDTVRDMARQFQDR